MERSGQSGLGIASLTLSVVGLIVIFVLFLIAGIWEASVPGGVDENSAAAVLIGLFIFGCLGLNLFSIGLGLAGIFQRKKSRICAFIGASISSASFVITVSVLALGLALDS